MVLLLPEGLWFSARKGPSAACLKGWFGTLRHNPYAIIIAIHTFIQDTMPSTTHLHLPETILQLFSHPLQHRLLALRPRLGVRNSGHTLAKLVDPCRGRSVRVVAVTHPEYLERMRAYLQGDGGSAMLLRGTEGEAYANPRRRPRMEGFHAGRTWILAEAEEGGAPPLPNLPDSPAIDHNVTCIRDMLAGEQAIPAPILTQVAALKAPGSATSLDSLGLTDRQLDVLRLIASGASNKVICRELNLAERTVKAHVTALFRALNVTSRTQAALAARAGTAASRPAATAGRAEPAAPVHRAALRATPAATAGRGMAGPVETVRTAGLAERKVD